MDGLASRLRCRVALYEKIEQENVLGETTFGESKVGDLWAEVLPMSGRVSSAPAEMNYSEITHKVTVRVESINTALPTGLKNDMYFLYLGKKLDVAYFMPHYKFRNCYEIFCKEDVENG